MKIAVISDIHSNIYALETVINDIKEKNLDLTVCVGDLVGYATFPNEVIDLIRKENILTVMGNYDDAVGNIRFICGCDYSDPKDAENAISSLQWSIENTSEENKEFLANLPKKMILTFEGRTITFVHGSPRKLNEYLKENSQEAKEVMECFTEDILVCGHTHIPYYKMYGEKMLVNSGSVGKPKTGNPNANYVILDVKSESVSVEVVEVFYDYEKTAKAIEESILPNEFANIIRTGRA
ncbi:metallophosphoesterase family protein [Tepidibacter formicigenes]|jgi:putative phosphoesterase|uniref:Phosphoesterase n=1 Tax=Tepidibacter formicigenes DSM 15518 TaxID=1123349 RepID=A0A1M6LI21_9FIRM|nr:metallophosphoesterase family protein [Tepidibacter formicigenes]SHJ70818.1 phosphoesterase, MJ0936 family [Tepidibacter formicigenes DSM 15518]